VLVVISLAGWLLAASAGEAQGNIEPTGHGDGTLTFGQLAPLTGQLSNIAPSFTTAVTIAIDDINAAGGVLSKPVGYSLADDGTNPDVAAASLESLDEGGRVDAIMGPTTSGTMLGLIDLDREAKVL
jgi:ABC-type branched-subunit amino acid transport system substrate-binding protein